MKPSTKEVFANNLRHLMKLADLNQTELAKKAGVSQKSISNILSGGQAPTIETAEKLAEPFGLKGWHLIMSGLPDDLISSPSIERLFSSYTNASSEGRKLIDMVAEREAKYQSDGALPR